MYILRCEPSGLGNVFLDCQQGSDQPHAGLQGNSPPGNKTHTEGEKGRTKTNLHETQNSHTGTGALSTSVPFQQEQPAAATE